MDDLEKIQETNWWRVCKLLIEIGTEQLLHFFENAVPRSNLRKFLVDNKSEIEQHRKKETPRHKKKLDLNDKQFTLLYFEKEMKKQTDDELDKEYRKTKIGNWDITLITCLLNYFFKNRKLNLTRWQHYIWNKIRILRNDLHAHIKRKEGFKMTDSEYKQHWQNVKKVLRDLNKFTPQINIEKKIESIQKETVVDGDKLRALIKTFDNWMQCEMDISEKLNQMEKKSDEQCESLTNTVNDGVTTVTEAVKESETTVTKAVKESETTVTEAVKESETTVTEAVKESETTLTEAVKENKTILLEGFKDIATALNKNQQILSQIQHQNQNQGAEATDRVPKKMHKGKERFSTQVSMDAEPDEGNTPTMETKTLPASSGNTGDSVTGSLHTDMEPTPGCSTPMPVSRKRKAEDNSPLSHKSKKKAAYDCFPKCETGAPGTSKSEAEEGLDTFPDIKRVQLDLINYYRQETVKSRLTIQGSSCQTDISNIYAEPDMEKVYHTALTAKMYAKETKQISYKEIFSGKRNREIYVCGDVGVGKTSFCKSLVSAWCSAHDEKDDDSSKVSDRGDSNDERERMSALKQFKILFYISLMHATIYSNIEEMVLSLLIEPISSCYGMKNSNDVLQMILLHYSKECLFILDGLEAWTPPRTSKTPSNNGTPDRNPTHTYCVLTTSLPWKLEELRLSGREIDLEIRLNGVRSMETFGSKLIEAFNNETKNKHKTYQNFEEEMALNTCLKDLQTVPIILKQLICLWYNDEGIGLSMTEIYMKILELLFRLKEGQEKVEPLDISADRQGTFIQSLPFKGLSRCKRHEQLLLSLGKLAFDTLFQEGKTLLVFEEDELSSYDISDKNIETSLKVGIVSQNIVPNMTSQRKGISFLHRSFHELFAAMFLASKSASDRDLVERFRSKCQSINDLQGITNMLMFLSCMCTTLVSELAECLVNAVNNSVVVFSRISSISSVYLRVVPFLCWVQNTFTKICFECNNNGKHLKLPVPVIVLIKENSKHLRSTLYQCFQEFPSQVKSFSCIGNSLDELAEFGTERSNDNRVLLDISKCCNLNMFRCINDVDAPVVLTLKIDANQLVVLSLKNVSLPHLNDIIRTAINLETLELEKVNFCEHPYNQTCTCTLFLDLTNCQKVASLQVKNTPLTRLTLNDKIHTLGLSSISFPHETWKELMISLSNISTLTTLKLSRVQCQEQCGAGPCRFDLNMSHHTQCHTIILKHMTLGSVILSQFILHVILKEIKMVHSELCSLFNSLSNYTRLETLVLWIACIAHASPAECDAMLELANQTSLQRVIYKDIKISGKPDANVPILNYDNVDNEGYSDPTILWKLINFLFYWDDITNDLIKLRQLFPLSQEQLRRRTAINIIDIDVLMRTKHFSMHTSFSKH